MSPASVAWRGRNHDLALLVPAAGAPPFRAGTPPIRIGRLAERAAIRVDALGFPRAARDAGTRRHAAHRGARQRLDRRARRIAGARREDGSAARARRLEGHVGRGACSLATGWSAWSRQCPQTSLTARCAPPAPTCCSTTTRPTLARRRGGASCADRVVDAAYVDALPRAGHWGGVRERYARAVVTTLCRIDRCRPRGRRCRRAPHAGAGCLHRAALRGVAGRGAGPRADAPWELRQLLVRPRRRSQGVCARAACCEAAGCARAGCRPIWWRRCRAC